MIRDQMEVTVTLRNNGSNLKVVSSICVSKIDLNFNILDSINVGMDDTNHSRYIHAVTFCKPTSTCLFFPASIITKYFVPTSLH